MLPAIEKATGWEENFTVFSNLFHGGGRFSLLQNRQGGQAEEQLVLTIRV